MIHFWLCKYTALMCLHLKGLYDSEKKKNLQRILFWVKMGYLELVSKELNHFGVITGLFGQIRGHNLWVNSRFVLFCSFWRLFTIKMIESIKVFPFSFWKIITEFFFFTSWNSNPRHKHAKWPPIFNSKQNKFVRFHSK